MTKLWRDDYGLDDIEPAIKASLEKLGLDYVDLYLVHWTFPKFDYSKTPAEPISPGIDKIWEKMEGLVDSGFTKSIGVSNCTVMQLANLLASARIKPANN